MTHTDEQPQATPEKIWAWRFAARKQHEWIRGGWNDIPDRKDVEYIRKDVHDAAIDAAVIAERERCAAIAEMRHMQWDDITRDHDALGDQIAAAILKDPQT